MQPGPCAAWFLSECTLGTERSRASWGQGSLHEPSKEVNLLCTNSCTNTHGSCTTTLCGWWFQIQMRQLGVLRHSILMLSCGLVWWVWSWLRYLSTEPPRAGMEHQGLRLFHATFPGRQAVETSRLPAWAQLHPTDCWPQSPKCLRSAPDPPTDPTFCCQSAYRWYTVICTSVWISLCDTFWVSRPRNATSLWSLHILDVILQASSLNLCSDTFPTKRCVVIIRLHKVSNVGAHFMSGLWFCVGKM